MTKRLALVVDDSRTARVTLKRMLVKQGMDVDTTESAQQALDYLIDNTPDVIFMDHMMPGMDGFQAIEAIKGNPETATIPIMMYTSKEGDLYVSQARALGAIGILPKQVEPAELFEVLNKLGLVKERRRHTAAIHSSNLADNVPELSLSATREDMQTIASKAAQSVNRHGQLGELVDRLQRETSTELHALRDAVDALRNERHSGPGWAALLLVLLVLLVPLLILLNQPRVHHDPAGSAVVALAESGEPEQGIPDSAGMTAAEPAPGDNDETPDAPHRRQLLYDSIAWAINQSSAYDMREEAFSDRRLSIIQELVSRLAALGFRGTVRLESHLGEFCLVGDETGGYVLAPPELPVAECTVTGHPLQDLPALGERQSIAFANFLSTSPLLANGSIVIDIVPLEYSQPLIEYPPRYSNTSAWEWNRIAAVNNRVEVHLLPAP